MKKLLCSALLAASGMAHAYDWVEGNTIGVPAGGPSSHMISAFFINSYTGDGMADYPAGQWYDVDISSIVPVGVKAVRLDGLLIITAGTTQETCGLTTAFRTPGQTTDYAYVFQAIEAHLGGGQRSTAGTWVAIDANRKFQIKWTRTTGGNWPTNCAYAINLRVTAYLK